MNCFEFPITERIRIMLRLENLYDRLLHFIEAPHAHDHHAGLLTLFEIMETTARGDLKGDLLQELKRQQQILEGLRNDNRVESSALENTLHTLEESEAALFASKGKLAQHLRENEWLMAIKQRAAIPGGTCQFDLPFYALWQRKPSLERQQDLQNWAIPLIPMMQATQILLALLRNKGQTYPYRAHRGTFQQMPCEHEALLIRVEYAGDLAVLPELSANKYALSVRFIQEWIGSGRPRQTIEDIEFRLTFCKF